MYLLANNTMMTKKASKAKRVLLILSIAISVLFVSLICFLTITYNKYKLDVDKLTSLNNGIKVYSSSGSDNTLYNTNRSIVDINKLPEHVKNAFIAIEDKNFYSHNGYDLKRIAKSAFVNFTTKSKSQGASTISQQLIKNALLSNEKTYSRKVKEVILSIKMEKEFSKDEILEMYLNTIYFGSNAYGIENASKTYFNKSAQDLSINESCCLAGLIKSPGLYSPKTNYENAIKRKNLVAQRMYKLGKINAVDYSEITNMDISLANSKEIDNSYEKEAIFEACSLLNITERTLINKKYEIITFKQDDLQKQVIEVNNKVLKNAEHITSSSLDSLSVVANNNGHVLAYYENSNYNLHNLTRQPASTLKPLAVYLPCFEHNILLPASSILDEPINYNGFAPNNADKQHHGYVSVRNALSNSLNIPAVKALDYLGVKKSKEMLAILGINISNSDQNLSLALGAVKNGVNILNLMSAYTTLANLGNYANLCFVNKILDEYGKVIYSHENYFTKVADEGSCFLINDILKDCATNGTAKRLSSLNKPISSKTGTASNNLGNTDLYNVAYTTEHTMLTWIADIDKLVLDPALLSSSQPTDINKQICEYLYANKQVKDFTPPKDIVRCDYDLVEYETNHILVKPNHNIDRYIAYDYFKTNNLPKIIVDSKNVDFNINVDKSGTTLDFEVKKHCFYKVYKKVNNNHFLLKDIKEKNGKIFITDTDIFSYDSIDYYITDENDTLISDIKTIKPKDYIINLFNNEILNSKKKWLV